MVCEEKSFVRSRLECIMNSTAVDADDKVVPVTMGNDTLWALLSVGAVDSLLV